MGMPDAEGHGPPDGLPDLPPEWGRVVVPDDASALAEEARQVRRELRRADRQVGQGPHLGPAVRPSIGLPVLVLLVAVLITLTGLAAVTWPRASRSGGAPTVLPYPTAPVGPLPALDLVGPDDAPVPLRSLLPAMIVLVDACACTEQVSIAAAAAPPGVTVVTVTEDRAAGAATAPGVRPLADPAGGLRSYLHLSAHPGTAAALLVDRQGALVRVVPELGPVTDYRDDLARLAG
ncbi:hypothetical protein [Micromonospora sp. AMSO31t]|uniref:hypothetical protein n=1 Tax=Micromonospora sp. AMSO31t TaxID=2650566 RepID=UPI00124BBD66|nr:hypothetical protein [Micromonospora sp. AMSO31t]KAB1913310.1 hypothetical protein F8274_10945 [Micromonospora sp. AMSO31t]